MGFKMSPIWTHGFPGYEQLVDAATTPASWSSGSLLGAQRNTQKRLT